MSIYDEYLAERQKLLNLMELAKTDMHSSISSISHDAGRRYNQLKREYDCLELGFKAGAKIMQNQD